MAKNDNINEVVQVISRIVENRILHLTFAGNILAIVKPVMLDNGINAYPILSLIGPPQSGKTVVARTVVLNKDREIGMPAQNNIETTNFYITTDINVSKLKKILKNRPNDYVILDDFAVFLNSDSRRKADRFLDEVVRPSHAGTSALLLLTAEEGAFDKITFSLHSRMIILPMENWKDDPQNKQLIDDIYEIRPALSNMLQVFSGWVAKRTFSVRPHFSQFQQRHQGKMDDRSISLFFAYDFSMSLFSLFLKESYANTFSMENFRKSYMDVWTKNKLRSLDDDALIKYLFSQLLEMGAFVCKIPEEDQLCENYCKGRCRIEDVNQCSGYIECCYSERQTPSCINSYNPYELILEDANNAAVLITNASYIYGMPKYKQIPVPLLIVGRYNLIRMLNNALEKFCIEVDMKHSSFSPNEVSSSLRRNGMCVSRITGDHYSFTFPYIKNNSPENKVSVYVLRLKKQEYDLIISKNRKKELYPGCDTNSTYLNMLYDEYHNTMPSALVNLCKDLNWEYLGTDAYTKRKYANT